MATCLGGACARAAPATASSAAGSRPRASRRPCRPGAGPPRDRARRRDRARTAALRGAHQGRPGQAAHLLRALLARRSADGEELRAHLEEEAHHQRPGRRGDGSLLRVHHAGGLPPRRVRRPRLVPAVPAPQGRAGEAPERRPLRVRRHRRRRGIRRPQVRAAPERQRDRPPRGRHDMLRLRRPAAGADLRQPVPEPALVLHLPPPGLLRPDHVVDPLRSAGRRSWRTSTRETSTRSPCV